VNKDLKYVGSKNRVAKHIVPIIQHYIDKMAVTQYIEPFVGGSNMIEHIRCKNKYGYDNNEYLIAFWQEMQNGWNPLENVSMSKEFYTDVKNNKSKYPKHIVALCGLCATYNAKWFGGYAGIVHTKIGTDRNYYDEAVRNVLKQRNSILDVTYDCKSYDELSIKNAVIYCDPPYEGTTKYKDNFDHKKYWEWVRNMSIDNIVICSEYNAPEDFDCIWTKELTTTLDKASRTKAIEKLFVHSSINKIVG